MVGLCRGIHTWSDDVIVATQPGSEWIYDKLRQELPRLRVLPGARVVQIEPEIPFDNVARWRAVAQFVRDALAVARGQQFVLECEHPLRGYWEGRLLLDLDALAAGLRALPQTVEYIWYPAGLGSGDQEWMRDATPRALALWRAVQAGLSQVVFTAAGPANSPHNTSRPWQVVNDAILRAEGRRTMDSIYVETIPHGVWPLNQVQTAVANVRTAAAYLYHVGNDWARLNATMAALMAAQPPYTSPVTEPQTGDLADTGPPQ